MQTFKKLVFLLALNFALAMVFVFAFSPPSQVKVLMAEARDAKYRTLILGQSSGECAWDPYLLSDTLGRGEAFNFSRRYMSMTNLRYMLEEANCKGQYKTVILDIDPFYWTVDNSFLLSDGTDTLLLPYLTGARQPAYFVKELLDQNILDVAFDYDISLLTPEKIRNNIRCKLDADYRQSKDSAVGMINDRMGLCVGYTYVGRGYRYGNVSLEKNWETEMFSEDKILQVNCDEFEKIAIYCREHQIELICVLSAQPDFRLKTENRGDMHRFFQSICDHHKVPFYDMNYIKSRYLSWENDDFVDSYGHMRGPLSQKHTEILAQLLNSDNPEEYFYTSYEEVVRNHCA